jgi:hypothetical protein
MSASDDALSLLIPCRRCKAEPGQNCETRNGRPAHLHSTRWWDTQHVRMAYWLDEEHSVVASLESVVGSDNPRETAQRFLTSHQHMIESITERLESA